MDDDGLFRTHSDRLDQGDVVDEAPLITWKSGISSAVRRMALVTGHGCDCEKYDRALATGKETIAASLVIHVAPLVPAADFDSGQIKSVKEGKFLRYFFLEGGGRVPDYFVDLHHEQPLPIEVVVECQRIATISEVRWQRIQIARTSARFHQVPENLFLSSVLGGQDEA